MSAVELIKAKQKEYEEEQLQLKQSSNLVQNLTDRVLDYFTVELTSLRDLIVKNFGLIVEQSSSYLYLVFSTKGCYPVIIVSLSSNEERNDDGKLLSVSYSVDFIFKASKDDEYPEGLKQTKIVRIADAATYSLDVFFDSISSILADFVFKL